MADAWLLRAPEPARAPRPAGVDPWVPLSYMSLPSMSTPEATPAAAPTVTTNDKTQYEPVQGRPLEVKVDDRGVERAIRKLRRLMASEGVLREIKRRRHYEKPSVKSKRKLREAERRRKRRERKKQHIDHRA